jgi:hypothetical protein
MLLIMVLSLTGVFSSIIGTGVNVVFSGLVNLIEPLVKFAMPAVTSGTII